MEVATVKVLLLCSEWHNRLRDSGPCCNVGPHQDNDEPSAKPRIGNDRLEVLPPYLYFLAAFFV
eukprot:1253501-Pyramimonas_sp.AAC.1